ncbi:helix-turn-helix transcriptional regulator [Anabaena sp. CCY 0017]|uniref:helix-turn-helix transcriptional regulator n=1 Tax=Anabaena sp. CCY 0017 TaxID=3103866 RepID=UPI0039C5B724
MANIISRTEYKRTWQQVNQNTQYPDESDTADFINYCPQKFGRGYHRHIQLRGMRLLIIDEEFDDDLYVESEDIQDIEEEQIEFGFNLSGSYSRKECGQSFLDWVDTDEISEMEDWKIFAKKRRLKVDIHLKSSNLLNSFIIDNSKNLPTILTDLIEGNSKQDFYETNIIAPEMYLPLEQIINCPFQGITKFIYLEGKCLELIALKLEQLRQKSQSKTKSDVLKKDDIERIHAAKVVLIKNINNPPSLIELARQVGLNDYKLKIGFHQVFGTTAFGYLHQYRMELSRQLLLERQMSIQEVARTVGYANHGCFAAAFRKRFGINPKYYRLKH